MQKAQSLSLVIPLYNEAEGIPILAATLSSFILEVQERKITWELLLIDDGSTDETADLLAACFPEDDRIHIIRHQHNWGVGAAYRSGIHLARSEIIVCYDADCSYPIEDIWKLYEAVATGKAQAASASPYAGGGVDENIPWLRRVLSRELSELYRYLLSDIAGNIRTFSAGFRAYQADIIKTIPFRADGFLAATEILVQMLLERWTVCEIPCQLSERKWGASKMKVIPTILAHIRFMVAISLGLGRESRKNV
ncbi:glycosyltransferase family 2 protein [Planctomycetota bacterium]